MTGKTHVMCSTAAVAVFALGHSTDYQFMGVDVLPWIGVVSASVGALLPDIDIPQSRLGQKFKFLSKNMKHRGITHTLIMPLCLLFATCAAKSKTSSIVACLIVGLLTSMMFDARTSMRGNIANKVKTFLLNKKGLVVTVVLIIATWFTPSVGASLLWGLMCGWALHIFEDLFNYKGCPIMYPLSKKHVHIASFKTRHWSEYVFLFLWLGGCALWALQTVAGR